MPGNTDGFLWYNVGEWQQYGLAVPNWGKDQNRKSQNSAIRDLVQIVGRNLCAVMWHADSRLRTPPSINTITRVHRLCVRARALLAANAVPANVTFMEPAHAIPAPEEHLVYPVPYFNVRNQFMKRWCNLGLLALTEAMQHQENARPLQFSVTISHLHLKLLFRLRLLLLRQLIGTTHFHALHKRAKHVNGIKLSCANNCHVRTPPDLAKLRELIAGCTVRSR